MLDHCGSQKLKISRKNIFIILIMIGSDETEWSDIKKFKIWLLNQFCYKNKNEKMIKSNKIHLILEYIFLLFILEKHLCWF